ncbi:MAG TPA: sigma-70 family RNA polymerase sigma factor [Candidatus Limnocylindria bacterium]|nr:sigma-70 family RNA polymerase sigma factor [Candidatus Limnocylindria bacterium]
MALNGTAMAADRPVDEEDERRLAVAAAGGDRRAFAALYDLHLDAVYRYCFFRLRSEADAEDVTSEVFHRALVAMPRYEPRRPFLAFLYTVARNVIADRARRARPVAAFDDAVATPTDAPGPEERSVALDEARGVREAIGRLTGLQQEVVVLRFIEGRSTQEIARALGKRESTIRGIQMRALAALRGILEAPR